MPVLALSSPPQFRPQQPAPRVLTGRAIERLRRQLSPEGAALLSLDLATGKVLLRQPTAEQAVHLAGTTMLGHRAARRWQQRQSR